MASSQWALSTFYHQFAFSVGRFPQIKTLVSEIGENAPKSYYFWRVLPETEVLPAGETAMATATPAPVVPLSFPQCHDGVVVIVGGSLLPWRDGTDMV